MQDIFPIMHYNIMHNAPYVTFPMKAGFKIMRCFETDSMNEVIKILFSLAFKISNGNIV